MRYVVDASVVVKWVVPEAHGEGALALLDAEHELLAPDLLWPETANVLWKKARLGEVTPDEARARQAFLATAPVTTAPSGPLTPLALELALATGRTVYDCLYLATAIAGDAAFVTADQRLWNALRDGPFARHVRWVGHAAAEPR